MAVYGCLTVDQRATVVLFAEIKDLKIFHTKLLP